MRALRRGLDNRSERSVRLWDNVRAVDGFGAATNVMVFDSIVGEPETAAFIAWCRSDGRQIAVPEDDVDPAWPDAIIVPGVAFTSDGRRVGQGGGWYDRFLPQRRPECITIGVCFAPQILADVPIEPHDVVLDHIVTD